MVQLHCAEHRPELVVVDVGGDGVAARVVGTVRKHEPSSMAATTAARALLGRIWCCLGVLLAGLPLLTLCAWRRRTLRRGRMSGATPSRTCCYVSAIPVLWAARSCSSTRSSDANHLKMRVGR